MGFFVRASSSTAGTTQANAPSVSAAVTTENPTDDAAQANKNLQEAVDNQDVAVALSWRTEGKLSSERKLHCINSTLKVAADYRFPFTQTSNRRYYLNHSHISGRNSCFYFSPRLNGLLCLPCVLFAPDKVGRGQSQPTGRLVTRALTDFSKLTGKDSYLTMHLQREYHEDAVEKVNALKTSSATGTIAMRLDNQCAEQIERNWSILRVIIGEIETCDHMDIPLCGHRDSGPINTDVNSESLDYTQGNLRCLLQKAAVKDVTFRDHLKNSPKNASYLSPKTQNNLVSSIATVMLRQLCSKITAAKFFAIGADETSDVSKLEQLTLTARYVDKEICECFLGFVDAKSTTGQSLGDTLLDPLNKLGLERRFLVAQAYDRASAMSGIYNSTQAVIKAKCPSAIYIRVSQQNFFQV